MRIEWTKDLETGIEKIDNEHKILVGWLNSLENIDSTNIEEMKKVFEGLEEYTRTHFKNEESLMDEYNYTHKPQHCEFHQAFIKEIQQYKKLALRNNITFSKSTQKFLADWLVKHIQGVDFKMSQEMKQNGAQ